MARAGWAVEAPVVDTEKLGVCHARPELEQGGPSSYRKGRRCFMSLVDHPRGGLPMSLSRFASPPSHGPSGDWDRRYGMGSHSLGLIWMLDTSATYLLALHNELSFPAPHPGLSCCPRTDNRPIGQAHADGAMSPCRRRGELSSGGRSEGSRCRDCLPMSGLALIWPLACRPSGQ